MLRAPLFCPHFRSARLPLRHGACAPRRVGRLGPHLGPEHRDLIAAETGPVGPAEVGGLHHPDPGHLTPRRPRDALDRRTLVHHEAVMAGEARDVPAVAEEPLVAAPVSDAPVHVRVQEVALLDEAVAVVIEPGPVREREREADPRRQGRPTDPVVRLVEAHPGRAPLRVRHPHPSEVPVVVPAAVVVSRPAPRIVGDEGPTVVGVDPASVVVRAPPVVDVPGAPHITVVRVVVPVAVGRKRVVEEAHADRDVGARRGRARGTNCQCEDQDQSDGCCSFHEPPPVDRAAV